MDDERPEIASAPLIPARRQALWGRLAVANFALGGLGAGFYAIAAAGALLGAPQALGLASWLGPALVLAGFAAVAAEAGRPLRGPRVLTRVATSWMSRELWIGGAFVALALLGMAVPAARLPAALAALGLAAAQGFILREARGVAAWCVGAMPALFAISAVVSGAGLALLVGAVTGRGPAPALLGACLFLLVVATLAWLSYLTWSEEPAFREAVEALRAGPLAVELVAVGYVLPFALLALALALPAAGRPAAAVAAVLIVAGQVRAKAALVLQAGRLRPITLATLRLRRQSP
jgi:anaerobic dimethyl sulfoxide reductase subunit C (anchor subunit)